MSSLYVRDKGLLTKFYDFIEDFYGAGKGSRLLLCKMKLYIGCSTLLTCIFGWSKYLLLENLLGNDNKPGNDW